MKTILIASALALTTALSAPVIAGPGMDADHGERMMQRMTERLGLSAEQQEQIRTIHVEQMARHKEIRQQTKSRMQEVLTDEQEQKLQEMHAERRKAMKDKYHAPNDSDRSN